MKIKGMMACSLLRQELEEYRHILQETERLDLEWDEQDSQWRHPRQPPTFEIARFNQIFAITYIGFFRSEIVTYPFDIFLSGKL